jgi:hypothetical protein
MLNKIFGYIEGCCRNGLALLPHGFCPMDLGDFSIMMDLMD